MDFLIWCKGLKVVDAVFLTESSRIEPSFVFIDLTIWKHLDLEHLFGANKVCILWLINHLLSVVCFE
jgi:hypothetical protein